MAGGKWPSVRFEILASLFVSAVAFSAVIMSQEAGEYVLKKKNQSLIRLSDHQN